MSFFKKLFGMDGDAGADGGSPSGGVVETLEHEGFMIRTKEMKAGPEFRVCAEISKEIDGETKTHTLIRADVCNNAQDASDIAMRKAKQVIKEQGEALFD